MERKTSPKPTLCRGGCGFYGSAATEGLCSECYKKHVEHQQDAVAKSLKAMSTKEPPILHTKSTTDTTGSKLKINQKYVNNLDDSEENPDANMPSTSQAVTPPSPPTPPNTNTDAQNESNLDETSPETTAKEKKNRCAECGKKVGLTGFTCRCGGLYCPLHRYSDKHNCTFNYREMGAEEIRRNNPTVTAEKIRKI